jgi:multiple sugar transport system substrate-binding protein
MSTETITRRDFLKQSALAGAAAAGGTATLVSAAEAARPATHSGATQEVHYWDFRSPVGSPTLTRWYDWLKKAFEQQNPGVTLVYQFLPWGDPYLQKIEAAVAAGNPPDVFECSILWSADLWERNVLYKMNDLIAMTPEVQARQFIPVSWTANTEHGAIFGVPTDGPDSAIIMMNVNLIAKTLGWPAATAQDIWAWPNRVQTWDDLTKLAQALTKRSGNKITVAGFDVMDVGGATEWFGAALASNGLTFAKSDWSGVQLDTPQAREVMQWLLDLLHKYQVSQPLSAQLDFAHELVSGKAAMIMDGTWDAPYLFDIDPTFRFMAMPFPRGPHGTTKGTVTWCNMVSMPRNVKNPALAWKLVTFLAAESTQLQRLALLDRYCPRRQFYDAAQWKAKTLKDPALAGTLQAALVGRPYPFLHHGSELQAKIGAILTEIMIGKVTPQAGLAQAQKIGDAILSPAI